MSFRTRERSKTVSRALHRIAERLRIVRPAAGSSRLVTSRVTEPARRSRSFFVRETGTGKRRAAAKLSILQLLLFKVDT